MQEYKNITNITNSVQTLDKHIKLYKIQSFMKKNYQTQMEQPPEIDIKQLSLDYRNQNLLLQEIAKYGRVKIKSGDSGSKVRKTRHWPSKPQPQDSSPSED